MDKLEKLMAPVKEAAAIETHRANLAQMFAGFLLCEPLGDNIDGVLVTYVELDRLLKNV